MHYIWKKIDQLMVPQKKWKCEKLLPMPTTTEVWPNPNFSGLTDKRTKHVLRRRQWQPPHFFFKTWSKYKTVYYLMRFQLSFIKFNDIPSSTPQKRNLRKSWQNFYKLMESDSILYKIPSSRDVNTFDSEVFFSSSDGKMLIYN